MQKYAKYAAKVAFCLMKNWPGGNAKAPSLPLLNMWWRRSSSLNFVIIHHIKETAFVPTATIPILVDGGRLCK